ncbi:MAG TPA: HAD family hydrolase [Accumulibacter sp.]|nr:HAD family hydrolase [Accumulibacter sp.]MCM8597908.1 HAD family hydrolase [Accumulibacter sp.]MCM8661766.1 HAD family hydrolase [Accumulibacter sp.]HNC51147.1 HAD family hydrolase [Accumulibacter sp.]
MAIPFDSATKFMATFHHDGDRVRVCVKGAPDVLLERSSSHLVGDTAFELDDATRAAYESENGALAGQALRVLALAGRVLALAGRVIPAESFDPSADLLPWLHDLTLHALVGIIDPPHAEVREAIATCRAGGIQAKMITGDHRVTAAAIARELGLEGETHEGCELDGLSQRRWVHWVPMPGRSGPATKQRR